MTGEEIVKAAMERRAASGLVLRFIVPGRSDPFVCYPKDEPQKTAWLENSARKGWALADGA